MNLLLIKIITISFYVKISNGIEEYVFPSAFEAAEFMGLPKYVSKRGDVGRWIKLGYIDRKSCKYNGWNIFKVEEVMSNEES